MNTSTPRTDALNPDMSWGELEDEYRKLETELAAEKARADAFEQATQSERSIHMTTIAERDALEKKLAEWRARIAKHLDTLTDDLRPVPHDRDYVAARSKFETALETALEIEQAAHVKTEATLAALLDQHRPHGLVKMEAERDAVAAQLAELREALARNLAAWREQVAKLDKDNNFGAHCADEFTYTHGRRNALDDCVDDLSAALTNTLPPT